MGRSGCLCWVVTILPWRTTTAPPDHSSHTIRPPFLSETHTHIVVWLTRFKRDFYIISHVGVSHQVSVNMCLGVSHADSLHASPHSRQRWAKDSVILSPLLTHLLRWMDNVLLMLWLRLIHLITQCNQTDPWEIKLFPRFIPAPVCSLLLFSVEC